MWDGLLATGPHRTEPKAVPDVEEGSEVTGAGWVPTLGCHGSATRAIILGPPDINTVGINPSSKNNSKCLKEYGNILKAAKN